MAPLTSTHSSASPSRRWSARSLLAGALLLLLAIFLLCWGGTLWLKHAMRASLPQLDGQLHVAGLSQPVVVRRDGHDVPHITAANIDDLVVAQGYVTAQDRLWQMDMLRRFASGNMAEIMGPGMVKHDRTQRILAIREAAEAALAALPASERQFLNDYARGVNAYIAKTGDHLPAEFRLLHYRPQPWRPIDSMLVALDIEQSLSMEFPIKLAREKIASRLHSPELMADLYPVGSWRDHPPVAELPQTVPPAASHPQTQRTPSPVPAQAQASVQNDVEDILRLERSLPSLRVPGCRDCAPGSNNWVVSGAHSVTGLPLLSDDMHLVHTVPDTWYEAQLTAGSFNVAGVTLPGIPFVIVGHNARIAWGSTLLYADTQDVYVEQVRGDEYKTPSGWRPLIRTHETIRVRGGRDVHFDTLRTDHGPVITPLLPHEQRTLTLAWTIYNPAALSMPLYQVDSAQNWQQFCAAFSTFGSPPQNMVYADIDGNIGYHAIGKVPLRPGGLTSLPITDSNHEWQGFIPFDKLPWVYNPPGGILATANSRVAPLNDPYPVTLDWSEPYRSERIWKVLESKPKLSAADMLALQNDVYSALDRKLAQRFANAIDHASHPTERLRQAADLMRSWDGEVTVATPAATIVDATRAALWPMLLQPRLGDEWKLYRWRESAFAQEEIVTAQPPRWLPEKYGNWNDFLADAVQRGMTALHAPSDLSRWHYGDVHPVEVNHPLYGMIPWLRDWTGTGIHPQSGNDVTVKQVGRSFGPSERMTVDFSNLDRSTLNIVIGQSGDPVSPYYKDQWPYWYHGTTFALPFSDSAVRAASAHTLTLVP